MNIDDKTFTSPYLRVHKNFMNFAEVARQKNLDIEVQLRMYDGITYPVARVIDQLGADNLMPAFQKKLK